MANEANVRGFRTRVRTRKCRDGLQQQIGGQRFDEDMVAAIIRNPVYIRIRPLRRDALSRQARGDRRRGDLGPRQQSDRPRQGGRHGRPPAQRHPALRRLRPGDDAHSSGKKTKDGTPYLYYACVDYTKDGSQTTCPVKMLPARAFEALIKQALADLGHHPAILQACVDAANREAAQSVTELEAALARHRDEAGRLTTSIRRLIEVMKQEDLLAEDIKDEYRRLVREKERRQARCEQLGFDLERRRKRVLDAGLIRRALQDFERLMGVLPLEHQKELFQLLVREVVVWPFEPEREVPQDAPPTASPNGRAGATAAGRAFPAKIRTRWYRVRIALSQLPNLPDPASVHHAGNRSGFGVFGSPRRGKSRTSSPTLTLLARAIRATRGVARLAYHFECATPLEFFDPPAGSSRQHRNPIALAQEWQRALDEGACPSRADLARQLGVIRARVTQVLRLLELASAVVDAIAALGDPLPRPVISGRMLRRLLRLPPEEQIRALQALSSRFTRL